MTLPRHLEWLFPLMSQYTFINLVTWENMSVAHNKRSFWGEYQPILVYGKTKDYTFNTYAEICDRGWRRWGGYSKNSGFKGQMHDVWDGIPFVYAGSIKHPEAIIKPGTNSKEHPCQMPVGIVQRVILFSTNEGDIVLDPFIGIGTTAVAAIRNKRHYLGFESDPYYVELANKRIANELNGEEYGKNTLDTRRG